MEKKKSIKKNMIMSIILTGANFVFPLITYSYVARVLTPVGTGKVAFVNSILMYFSYIAILGIPSYGLRECAKIRDNKKKLSHLVQELFIINIISTIVAYIALIVAVLCVPKLSDYKYLFAVMGMHIFMNTIGVEWIYQALEEYKYITIRSLIFKVVSVVLTFVLIKTADDVLEYGFLSIFTLSASNMCNFVHVRKKISWKKTEPYCFRKHLKPILTLFFASIIVTIYANFDVSMIGLISTEHEVGLYNAALKIKSIILSISTAVTAVIIPRMAYYFKKKQVDEAKGLMLNSIRTSLILAVPFVIYIFLFAENVLTFICGSDYIGAVPTLRVLMLCVIPLILTNLFGNQILIPLGFEKRYSQSVFVGMWINLVLNLMMIPFMGSFGAAIGTLVTECWNVLWMSGGEAKDYRKFLMKNLNVVIYILSLVVAGACSMIVYKFVAKMIVFWQLVFSTLVFFGVYYLLLLTFKEPLLTQQTRKIIRKIRWRIFRRQY